MVYTSTLLFITEGSQGRNSKRAGAWRQELMHENVEGQVLPPDLLPMACSTCFLTEPRTTSPGMVPPTVRWVIPHQSIIKKVVTVGSHEDISSTGAPSLMTPPCVKLTSKPSSTAMCVLKEMVPKGSSTIRRFALCWSRCGLDGGGVSLWRWALRSHICLSHAQ